MLRFEDLDTDEQRNEILKEILNQLSKLNKWLEVGIALYAKLSDEDIEVLKEDALYISTDHNSNMWFSDDPNMGYTKERGLYRRQRNISEPLGDYDCTAPIDEDTGFFIENQ